ncbi:MAG: hypothetical protein RIE58_03465 [Vicingaceae bacterium]
MAAVKKVLFLTTANLTTNPRLYKELEYFQDKVSCSFLGFSFDNWTSDIEIELQKKLKNVELIYLPAGRSPFFPWLWSTLTQRLATFMWKYFQSNLGLSALASNKRTLLLNSYLSKTNSDFDLVIAHNLGALYPAYKFAKKNHTQFAFDLEDYHPGEHIDGDQVFEQQRRESLLKQLLPTASYISYASPLIGKALFSLCPELSDNTSFLITNGFHGEEFKPPELTDGKLKVVWFSQYIDYGRGLEILLTALDKYSDQLSLHLIGDLREQFRINELESRSYVESHKPMTQHELHKYLSNFDLGLAIEMPDRDMNRDICLTNKIFAYAQAGLYVLASDTSAQKDFIEKYPWLGKTGGMSINELSESLERVLRDLTSIRALKNERYQNSKSLDWKLQAEHLEREIIGKKPRE